MSIQSPVSTHSPPIGSFRSIIVTAMVEAYATGCALREGVRSERAARSGQPEVLRCTVMRTVARISVTPVKGFALLHPDEVELTEDGVVSVRRFLLVNADGKRLRSSLTAWPIVVSGEYDAPAERLRLRFPDGAVVDDSALGSGPRLERPALRSGGPRRAARAA